METGSGGKPLSLHTDSPGYSQYSQSSARDDQMQSVADSCDPPYAQISVVDTQIEK